MPNLTTVSLSGYRSWFNSTRYAVMDKLDLMLEADPVLELFSEITDGGKEDSINMTGRANDGYAHVKSPGEKANLDGPVEEDQMSKNFFTISERANIEWESFVHDKYSLVTDAATELYEKIMATVYLAVSHQIFNFGTSTTVNLPGAYSYDLTTPDTYALYSASHTTPSGATGKSNLPGTQSLSSPNLDIHVQTVQENIVSSKGNAMAYNPDILFVSANCQRQLTMAQQITRSQLVPSTGNNAYNVYSGGTMDVVALKHTPFTEIGAYDTTKQYYWGTAKRSMLKKVLKYKWAARPVAYPKFMDQENGDSSYLGMGRFGFGASRWQGIALNNSTTAPISAG